MRVDLGGRRIIRKQLEQRALNAPRAIVDHDWNVGNVSRDHCLIVGLPLRPGEMRALDAYDHARELPGLVTCQLAIHVIEIVLVLGSAHPGADDVQLGKHARVAAVDHAILEVVEVAPA